MSNNQEDLFVNKELREEVVSRIEVLDKVGNLLLLPNTEFATVQMCANYYITDHETVKKLVQRHNEEFVSDGFSVVSKDILLKDNMSLKTKRGGFDLLDDNGNVVATGSNKGIALLPKRAILRVGMLLRDSEVAKEIRTQLLNIVDNVHEECPDLLTKDIVTEQQLLSNIGIAYNSGDMVKVLQATMELDQFKNRKIKEQEELLNKSKPFVDMADKFFMSSDIDIERLSKTLAINGMGRNKMFSWLRDNKILKSDNLPYQTHVKYFNVINVTKGSFSTSKSLVNKDGVIYIYNKLIKDGFIIERTLEDALNDLYQVL